MNKQEFESIIKDNLTEKIRDPAVFEALCTLTPDVRPMKDYDQNNKYHCFDLLTHTVMTVDGVCTDGLSDDEIRMLKTAAFFHDIGKPYVAVIKDNPDGSTRTSYPGHPEKSEELAYPVLQELGYPEEEIRKIRFYITAHDLFLHFVPESASSKKRHRNTINERNILRVQNRIIENRPELGITHHDFFVLLHLCRSDMKSHNRIVYNYVGNIVDTYVQMEMRAMMIQDICYFLASPEIDVKLDDE